MLLSLLHILIAWHFFFKLVGIYQKTLSKPLNSSNFGIKCAKQCARRWFPQWINVKCEVDLSKYTFKPLWSPSIVEQPSMPANLIFLRSTSLSCKCLSTFEKMASASHFVTCTRSKFSIYLDFKSYYFVICVLLVTFLTDNFCQLTHPRLRWWSHIVSQQIEFHLSSSHL